jgi:alpha-tubulin suppressor-like RCC1 family protein
VRRRLLIVVAAASLVTVAGSAPAAGPSVSAIAVGYLHTCALLNNGAVKCWGDNGNGQLGDGTKTGRHSAVPVAGLPGGIRTLVAGGAHTCALLTAGGLACWGDNEYGQLGDGVVTANEPPKIVSGLSHVSGVAPGAIHTCAIVTGGVECWGDNRYGQLGDGTTTNRLTPVPVAGLGSGVEQVSAGAFHTCALQAGAVKCWGDNEFGQLGDRTTTDRPAPVTVSGLGSGVRAVAAGVGHTCALLAGGGVKCWGDDEYGQLGDGDRATTSPPVSVTGLDGPVNAIATGFTDTCALLQTGEVECWGNLFEDSAEPVRGLERGASAIGISGDDTYEDHACAILGTGGVVCWGANDGGEIGNGIASSNLQFTPAPVLGLANGVHVLTVGVSGHGTVTGASIRCKDQCGYERPQGTAVALAAHAARGAVFKGWSGACKGRRTRCSVVLNAELTVTARFAKRR